MCLQPSFGEADINESSAENRVCLLEKCEFKIISHVDELPIDVLKEFYLQTKDSKIADPGQPYQSSDMLAPGHLPWRRLIFGGVTNERCLIVSERGGYAPSYEIDLFSTQKGEVHFLNSISLIHDGKLSDMNSLREIIRRGIKNKSLNEHEAIEKAEAFVVKKGYTWWPISEDKIAFEAIEQSTDTKRLLKTRHNSLEVRAYGITRGRKGGAPGWAVVFRRKDDSASSGRAVTMNLDGSEIRMEHEDFRLAAVEHRL
jgi:hypothetical protein